MTALEDPPIARPSVDQPVWRNSHFMKLWIAQGVSQTIQNLTFFALMVYVERETRSTTHMAALVISTILPAVLFGVTAGVFVDRWNKRVVLVATNVLRAIAVLGYLVIFAGNLTLEQAFLIFYGLNFVFSTISQFFLPAEGAMVPFLVGRERLIAANGLLNITFSASQVLGFLILGPPLVGAFGTETVLIGIAVAYLLCGVLLMRLPNDRAVSTGERRGVFSGITDEILAGWRLLRGDAAISLAMIHLTVATTVMLILGALAPGFTNRALGLGPEFTVVIFGPAGAGILLGAFLLARLVRRFRKLTLINVSLVTFGVGMICVAATPALHSLLVGGETTLGWNDLFGALGLIMVFAFFMGMGLAIVNVAAQTVMQERAPADMRGRVFAVQLMFGSLASVIPLVIIGQLADAFGVLQVLVLVGLAILSVAYFSIVRTRVVRQLDTSDDPVANANTAPAAS